jgi:predicted RNA binding protein YcfA (HicA-like mRNA interferase family)
MTHAPRVTAEDVCQALRRPGFVKVRQRGSHQKWKHPISGRITIVPTHPRQTIHPKTLATIIEGAGISMEEFRQYL